MSHADEMTPETPTPNGHIIGPLARKVQALEFDLDSLPRRGSGKMDPLSPRVQGLIEGEAETRERIAALEADLKEANQSLDETCEAATQQYEEALALVHPPIDTGMTLNEGIKWLQSHVGLLEAENADVKQKLAVAEMALGFPIVAEHIRRYEEIAAENARLREALSAWESTLEAWGLEPERVRRKIEALEAENVELRERSDGLCAQRLHLQTELRDESLRLNTALNTMTDERDAFLAELKTAGRHSAIFRSLDEENAVGVNLASRLRRDTKGNASQPARPSPFPTCVR